MYFTANIKYENQSVAIEFPISDFLLDSDLKRAGMPTDTTLPFVLSAISPADCFSVLRCRECDLDELNFLAKRLDSFTDKEYLQFKTAAEYIKPQNLKDFINLTFNLDKFTLIQDISDMVKVGRDYELNTLGSIPCGREFDTEYAKKGRELLRSGKGIFTDNGLLFVEDKPMDELYNGRSFPPYAYEMFSVSAELRFGDYSETVFLPCCDISIEKAARRLGAKSAEECSCELNDSMDNYDCLRNCFDRIIENEGIKELNSLIQTVEYEKADPQKLATAVEFMGVHSKENVKLIAENLDSFEYIPGIAVSDFYGIGRYMTENCDKYRIDGELEGFVDFEAFGQHIFEKSPCAFVSGGFIRQSDNGYLNELSAQFEDETDEMKIGGI